MLIEAIWLRSSTGTLIEMAPPGCAAVSSDIPKLVANSEPSPLINTAGVGIRVAENPRPLRIFITSSVLTLGFRYASASMY